MESQLYKDISSPKISQATCKTLHSTPNEKKDLLQFSSQTPLKTPSSSAPRCVRSRVAVSVPRFNENASKSLDAICDAQEDTGIRSARRQMTEWAEESGLKIPHHAQKKFEYLVPLFDALDIAVRVLRLKKCQSTFPNISKSVEALIERPFTYSHLAQIKYLMQEYIEITRTRVLDETKSSSKPELRVTLHHSNVGMKLKSIFRSKLADFSISHPEMDDVPEATLPYPFSENQVSPISTSPLLKNKKTSFDDILPASHFPPLMRQNLYTIQLEKPGEDIGIQRVNEDEPNSMNCTPVKEVPVPSSPCSNTPAQHSQKTVGSRKLVKSVSRSLFSELSGDGSDLICEDDAIETVEIESETKRLKTTDRLLKLFDRVHDLYLSLNKSILTKDELVHKLIFYNIGFEERGDLEEELNFMIKLVPEYIFEKTLLCGDKVICLNQSTSSAYAREQLEIANV